MSRAKEKALVLALVFLLALIVGVTQAPVGRGDIEEGSAAAAASLPVLCFELGNRRINPLEGYSQPMEEGVWDRAVYPFGADLELTLHFLDGSEMPEELYYELRGEPDDLLIERGSSTAFVGSRDDLSLTMELADLLEPERDYRLNFELRFRDHVAYYYTRAAKANGESRDWFVEYAFKFHEAMFDKDAAEDYAAKLEPDSNAKKEDLAYVNIHSNMDQVTYGDAELEQTSDSWLTIEELEGNYGYLHFDYLAQAEIGAASPARFRLREAMTLQRSGKQMYLLRYERHMEQLWEIEESAMKSGGLLLGVQEESNLQLVSSKNGRIQAFVVAGELYSYDSDEQKLCRIFSFRSGGEDPLRSFRNDYRIRLTGLADNGDLEFLVYGYMNGGRREGCCGLCYYRYDAEKNSLSEKMFLPSRKGFSLLQAETETLFCRGEEQFLYFSFDGQVFVIDLSSGETAVLVTRQEMPSLVVNEAGNVFAWQSGSDQIGTRSVRVMNLAEGTSLSTEVNEDEFIRTLGFIREDLIVGVGRKASPCFSNGQEELIPLSRLRILDENMEILTDYGYKDIYISGVEQDAEKVGILRYGLKDGKYCYLDDDMLLRGDVVPSAEASPFTTYTHSTLQRMYCVPVKEMGSFLRLDVVICDLILAGEEQTLPDDGDSRAKDLYMAYGKGALSGVFTDLGSAIAAAQTDYGYVLDQQGRLLWAWCSRSDKKELSVSLARPAEGQGLSLTGAPFRSLVYFLEAGRPILWYSPESGSRWIVGYTLEEAKLYDPATEETSWIPQTELVGLMERNNNYVWIYP